MQSIIVSPPSFAFTTSPVSAPSFSFSGGLNPFTLPMCQDAPSFGGDNADMARRRRRRYGPRGSSPA